MRVIGLISGTSMDGIDVAAADLELRNEDIELRPLGATSVAYDVGLRRDLEAALPPASTTAETICRLDNEVGRAFAAAASRALHELAPDTDLLVSHGQTLYHWVEQERVLGTLQIGQPAWIAATTGLPVVADLRAADIAAGGQGAPLASVLDQLLLNGSDHVRAALNIGGIANLTVVGPTGDPVAFDTGPGNALIDVAVRHVTGGEQPFDREGARARRGTVQGLLLDRLLADPYYRRPPPKSTGKEHFHLPYLLEAVADTGTIEPEDLVATVTALTAITVADACRANGVEELIVSGGGVSNPAVMAMLTAELPNVVIRPIDDFGIPAAAKEAYLIALIGFLSVHGLPGNVPSATGATRPVVLGCLLPGRTALALPSPVTVAPSRLHVSRAQAG
jgi:anhydro-N-acetylmuramic acid kinase